MERKRQDYKAYAFLYYRSMAERQMLYDRDIAALEIAAYNRKADLVGISTEAGIAAWRNILPAVPYLVDRAENDACDYLLVNQVSALGKTARQCIHTAHMLNEVGVRVISMDGEVLFPDKVHRSPEEKHALHIKKSRLPDR